MFFSGDSSAKKRVDLGGRSSKERDRQKLLEQMRLERNQRLWLRQQNSAALKIQKCFRGRKIVEAKKSKERELFFITYGNHCQNVDRFCFGPDSEFLRQLLYFFNSQNMSDLSVLVETCRLLQQFVQDEGDIVSLFAGVDYSSRHALVNYRVKSIANACIQALYRNRYQLKDQIWMFSEKTSVSTLLMTVISLMEPKLPWVCQIVGHLVQKKFFSLLRDIILTAKDYVNTSSSIMISSSVEQVLVRIISHIGQIQCICPEVDPQQSFSSQILTVPFLWKPFPRLKEVFATPSLSKHYIHQMALCVRNYANVLPSDTSNEFPSHACLLGNILEAVPVALSQRDCSFDMAMEFAAVTSFLLRALPPLKSIKQSRESSSMSDEEMTTGDEITGNVMNIDLGEQISNAIDPRFFLQLTNILFRNHGSFEEGTNHNEAAAVGAACALLEVAFSTLPLDRIMTVLAYRTELVLVIWKYMKHCHEKQSWSPLPGELAHLSADAPGWLLPLAVFCPVYKHMLTIIDNEEFYEQERPLSLNDISSLIIILRQALWQILWMDAASPAGSTAVKSVNGASANQRNPAELMQRVSIGASELLSQLQDWNNRREFTPPSNFHADGVNDQFVSQAGIESTKASFILKQAPFLVPFSIRASIFISQLMDARHRNGSHAVFPQNRFKIRRDHILEDAYNQLSALSEENLRELIRVSFVNEFGVEEAGIDGGGIFKDFMENITRSAFDVQYGLFKETADHLLYPNPASGIVHDQHLQYFHFLGTILAKAMYEGILVDIPFATFFLSKLKQKYNYLNDLPSLDPELYRHLIFLKRYKGDLLDLELYFVILNNEYGVQSEEELLPGGKNMRVTNDNVITFIHLVANHRLNFQIRQQSSYFLRGFQQLIQKEWIDMFNEHELQLLISGSLDHMDVDDLRKHTNYTGGYHNEHYVIQMFWEVLQSFSLTNQMKFLKFVTGCSRGPLLGFKYLEPLFCIQRSSGSVTEEAVQRLPTSATCMNLLKLPPYESKEQMEMKLMYAINADAGFDLS